MTGSKTTNSIKRLTRREKRTLIAALIIVPFLYPFLLTWFAHNSLDDAYHAARRLPERFRNVVPLDDVCLSNLDNLKDNADRALLECVSALPNGSKDILKGRRLLKNLNIPLFDRGVILWRRLSRACDVPEAVYSNPEQHCRQAAENFSKAAVDLEKALSRFEQTRILTWVLLYIWLVAEIFGWIVVLHFARRFLRERAEAKASSQSRGDSH